MICCRCHADKPPSEFSPRQTACKACRRDYDRKRKEELTANDRIGEPCLGLHARHMAALREHRVWFGPETTRPHWLRVEQEQAA